MTTATVATYDMEEDATGLAAFIREQSEDGYRQHGNMVSPIIYVFAEQKNGISWNITSARMECETLTDGSKTYNLYLRTDQA